MSREEQFDGMLMEMVQQHGDSFSDLFGTVFSFLARRTNFYTDGDEDHVEKLVINQLTKCRNTAMIENNEAECDPLIIKLKHEFEQAFPAELDEENTESISKEDEKIKSLENFHLITEALIHTKKAERAQRKKYRLLGRLIKERPIDSKRNTAIDADMPTSQHQELSSLLLSTDKQEGKKTAKRYGANREIKHAAKKEKKRQEEKERAAKSATDNDDDSRIVELTDEQADASQAELDSKKGVVSEPVPVAGTSAETSPTAITPEKMESPEEEEDETEKGKLKSNTGNGADMPKYKLTQPLQEVEVVIKKPKKRSVEAKRKRSAKRAEREKQKKKEIKEIEKLELVLACRNDDVTLVKKFLAKGHSVNTAEKDLTLLAVACEYGSLKVAQLLLKKSASVEDRGINGEYTPLMIAASRGHIDIVNALLERGALVDAKSSSLSLTPLMYAVLGNFKEVVESLLHKGADPTISKIEHQIPKLIKQYADFNDILKILTEHKSTK